MRYAIFTDIHANLEALEAVLAKIDEIAKDEPIDQIWFLGDLVGYGPDPNECIRALRERTDVIIAGNHDWAAVGKIDLEDFSAAARVSAEWTAEQLTKEYRDFLADLPERLEIGDCTLVHGSPFGPLWEYLTSETLAERSFLYFDTRYCVVGHTHVPVIFIQPDSANIPTIPLDDDDDDDETTAHGYANGAANHHEQAGEEGTTTAGDETRAVGEADSQQTRGEMDEDETVELAMIQSKGQQSTLTAADHTEPATSAYQEPHGNDFPAQFEEPAPEEQQAPGQSNAADNDLEPAEASSDSDPAEEHNDDDETVIEFSLVREETQEYQDPLDTTDDTGDDDDATVMASSNDLAIGSETGEAAINQETEGQDAGSETIDGDPHGDGNGVGNSEGTGEESGVDEVHAADERTPVSEIENAEERLTGEIEELLKLLGLSQSMAQVTNEMLTPPQGHWETPPDHRAIINPGGVGQPRDGDPRAAFMIYDTERGFKFYRVPYDFEKTQEKIINAGLPQFLAVRLAYGR